MCICISGWILQKVLAEIEQKGFILSQKALISGAVTWACLLQNRFASLQKTANRKISPFNP